jgi:hypothetical protein
VLAASAVGQTKAPPALFNQVEDVRPFALDQDSGSMALHAFTSCLDAIGTSASYSRLVAISGTAFAFVYDTTEAYEPLRDLFPTDVFKVCANALGFPNAHWEMDQPIDTVKAIVRREIDAGRGVLAPFLKNEAYHGFFVITGYDFSRGVFRIQGAFRDTAYVEVPIPASWSGPTASPMGWAVNPVFVLGEKDPAVVPSDLDKRMVEAGAGILRGGDLTYGTTPGELAYMAAPGPHKARYGIPAYALLALDVASRPLTVTRDGTEALNFGFIWRMDSQLGQLQQARGYGAIGLDFLSTRVSGGKSPEIQAIADNEDKASADARALREMFWDRVPRNVATARDIVDYVKSGKAMVFSIAGREALVDGLRGLGLKVFQSPWGPAVVQDSPERRLQARLLVKSLETRDRVLLRGLGDAVSYIAPDLGVPAPESPRTRRHKK